jgi:hypothetical protein
MADYLDNTEVASFLNICNTYWKTFTFDESVTVENAMSEFTQLVTMKAEESNYKTINIETILLIISSYRELIKSTRSNN